MAWPTYQAMLVTAAQTAGRIASLLLMSTFFAAVHNNSLLLLAFGLPFDRALPWHKLLAFSAIVNSTVHLLAFYVSDQAKSVVDAYSDYHITKATTKVKGLEISGVLWLQALPTQKLPCAFTVQKTSTPCANVYNSKILP